MREKIRKWLGIDRLEGAVNRLEKPTSNWQQEEELRNSRIAVQLITQVIDYLGLDFRKDLVQDPSRLREPEPMRETYTIIKKKKK